MTGLAACQTAPEPLPQDTASSQLAPRNLDSGDCGLFVWRSDPSKPFIYFSSSTGAAFHDGRQEIALAPSPAPLAPRQDFRSGGQLWTLDLRNPAPAADGTRFDAGTLSSMGPQGWRITVPVVGLRACIV